MHGFAQAELNSPLARVRGEDADSITDRVRSLSPGDFPQMLATAETAASSDATEEFGAGLETLIRGLEAGLAAPAASRVDMPPESPEALTYDTSPGASWDMDGAELRRVSVGAFVIDSAWIPEAPGLPDVSRLSGLDALLGDLLDGLPFVGLEVGRAGG